MHSASNQKRCNTAVMIKPEPLSDDNLNITIDEEDIKNPAAKRAKKNMLKMSPNHKVHQHTIRLSRVRIRDFFSNLFANFSH